VEAFDRLGQQLEVLRRPPEARHPREAALDDPPPRQQDVSTRGLWQLHDMQRDPVVAGVVFRLLTGVALVHVGQFHVVAGGPLDRLCRALHLGSVLLVDGRHVERKQVANCVNGDVDLGSLPALRPVVPGSVAALGQAQERAAVDDDGGGLLLAADRDPEDLPEVMDHVIEDAGLDPALHLLVDGRPRRQVVADHAPGTTGAHDPPERVVDLAEVVLALRRILADQREVGLDQLPLVILDVGRIGLPCNALPSAGRDESA
jgi:hypothetical protein